MKQCQFCRSEIQDDARKCPYCVEWVRPNRPPSKGSGVAVWILGGILTIMVFSVAQSARQAEWAHQVSRSYSETQLADTRNKLINLRGIQKTFKNLQIAARDDPDDVRLVNHLLSEFDDALNSHSAMDSFLRLLDEPTLKKRIQQMINRDPTAGTDFEAQINTLKQQVRAYLARMRPG